ncbi:transposase [Nonomuraea mesophila]|uniref:Transposase n=1 Tax=Nonomuraea mesophila TaxID=2530382 RepID=A0A4R5FXR9_9ACTN|nr:transposase [Nonomuraea mesophila]TDE60343.1 transposase [Nonomuraea mesophila]
MDRRWIGLDGYEVLPAIRAGRQVLRVRRHGCVIADCTSVAQVARLIDLAELCEVIELPAHRHAEAPVRAGTSSHQG